MAGFDLRFGSVRFDAEQWMEKLVQGDDRQRQSLTIRGAKSESDTLGKTIRDRKVVRPQRKSQVCTSKGSMHYAKAGLEGAHKNVSFSNQSTKRRKRNMNSWADVRVCLHKNYTKAISIYVFEHSRDVREAGGDAGGQAETLPMTSLQSSRAAGHVMHFCRGGKGILHDHKHTSFQFFKTFVLIAYFRSASAHVHISVPDSLR